MSDNLPTVEFPAAIVDLTYPLMRLRQALDGKGPVRIVAMGSSSTAGRADVVPYPYRLEMYLRQYFKDVVPRPDIRIDVLNRGKGGEEANEELGRFEADIFREGPALVIWQVGTNAVFHNEKYDVDIVAGNIREGLAQLRARGFEVLVIDPQFVTKMLWDDRAELADKMVRLIREAANEAEVNLFQRWSLMRHWHVQNNVSLEQLIDTGDPDKLHQNDWSTQQVSLALKNAIIKALGPMA
ncbi:SGNH/GDSL hydrolase family protein [Bradyrhizobium sp. CB1015]|uniref:SGNH/GDSL hydrolase family protein n=1 Tax=Bradyrhizobium sp. CB1015 TaxID=2976822 RepID=UPI0021AA0BEA|nr:SGNH/GDSL hydrolase family protein [Bradyrhizobium sp. CB1015]UWU88965.1 SGNH/GDSL hydrolase family protein [Bradyrhizobium sp. CB1015]